MELNLDDPECASGRVIGGYTLGRFLGSGATAAVYEASHPLTREPVAIKLFHADSPAQIARFGGQEARIASRVRHPHLVHAREYGTDGDQFFIVLELVKGEPLSAQRGRPMPWPELVSIVLQVLGALSALHASGFVHRDVKPENVFVLREGNTIHVTLLDLGFAYAMVPLSVGPEPSRAIVGTDPYIPPELIGGATPTPRNDLYSVGVLMYELLTGQHEPWLPFRQPELQVPSPTVFRPGLPEALGDAVLCALSDVDSRFASGAEMAAALSLVLSEAGDTPEVTDHAPALAAAASTNTGEAPEVTVSAVAASTTPRAKRTSRHLGSGLGVAAGLALVWMGARWLALEAASGEVEVGRAERGASAVEESRSVESVPQKTSPAVLDAPEVLAAPPNLAAPPVAAPPDLAATKPRVRAQTRKAETLAQAMARLEPQIRSCAESSGGPTGPVTVELRFERDALESVRVLRRIRSDPFSVCVDKAVRGASLPRGAGLVDFVFLK